MSGLIEFRGVSIPADVTEGDEFEICCKVIDALPDDIDRSKLSIQNRSGGKYTTLAYDYNDFFRVKFTDRTKWFSVDSMNIPDMADSPIFAAQQKKTERHWKAKVESMDELLGHLDLIVRCFYEV